MTHIAAVVLAAGASTRFGECKQLLDWGGKPMLAHVTDVALRAGLDPVIAVIGYGAAEMRAALGDRPVRTLMSWRWEEGLAASVRTGLAGVPPDADGAVFLQCDQPLVTAELLQAMVERFEETGTSIVHPTHDGRRGTPVLFGRRFFAELSGITGDEGGRSLIDGHPEEVATVAVSDPAVLMDMDRPEAYAQLRAARPGSARVEQGDGGAERQARALQAIRHVIVDMDGVLWRGDEPLPGMEAFFSFLKREGIGFILATNNSTRTPDQYAGRLARYGVEVPKETILTSALVSAAAAAELAPAGAKMYVIGEEGIQQALLERGFVLDDEEADYVVVGWDRQLTWDKLATASLLIHGGAAFLGTNPDTNFPTEAGPVPGDGAILAAIEVTTGVEPLVTGKPAPQMYEEAMRRMDATPETTAMIGDRLDTDIAGAERAGLTTILVLSGIATAEDVAGSQVKPDVVCADIEELVAQWQALIA